MKEHKHKFVEAWCGDGCKKHTGTYLVCRKCKIKISSVKLVSL